MKTVESLATLCFGGNDWWYHNRAHVDFQLMRRYALKGPVLYINSVVMTKPSLKEGKILVQKIIRKAKSIFRGSIQVEPNMWVYSPFSLPLQHSPWFRPMNEWMIRVQIACLCRRLKMQYGPRQVVWIVCPSACDMVFRYARCPKVYLRTDVYELFPGVDQEQIRDFDRRLKAECDVTVFVSRKLYDDEAGQCKKPLYVDHGVDYDLFSNAQPDKKDMLDMASIPGPIAGYFGSIDGHTVDYELIDQITDMLPKWSFVFVGKVYDNPPFVGKRNVWMLGHKEYRTIPSYGALFDVALMPWRQTEWIDRCNPIKLKEYLALGKPVVSTPFRELEQYLDNISVAHDAKEFAESIQRTFAENTAEKVLARKKKVQRASWESKAEQILSELNCE